MESPSQDELRIIFNDAPTFEKLYQLLLDWKEKGIDQDQSYEALALFRSNEKLSEQHEDMLLDSMDVVVGHCSPHIKIW